MKHIIVFFDTVCPKPYSSIAFAIAAMGGTEATVIRVAERLALEPDTTVYIAQHNRTQSDISNGVHYTNIEFIVEHIKPTHIIILRSPLSLPFCKETYPHAKLYLWLHDLATPDFVKTIPVLEITAPKIICVSQFHKQDVIGCLLRNAEYPKGYTVDFIYNPIADDLKPDNTRVNPTKLVYFSSPHKGLEQVLNIFEYLLIRRPDFQLYIANPGYYETSIKKAKNVHVLGSLPHHKVLKHVRQSFAVFYPSSQYATRETFGIVFAEANAVGTPVIAHNMGAAYEVIGDNNQVFDCRNIDNVVNTLGTWREHGRPKVTTKAEFRLERVIEKWQHLLK